MGGQLVTEWAQVCVFLKRKADLSLVFVKRAASGAVMLQGSKKALDSRSLKEIVEE